MTHASAVQPIPSQPAPQATNRVGFVDYAKGWCIVLVVMMHTTLGLGEALGHGSWLNSFIAFAKPFRMPDFFLISGLFLSRVIDRDWRTYVDRKVVHFAYFYLVWMTLQIGLKEAGVLLAHPSVFARDYALAFIEPFGTLWFIYLLPVFFLVARVSRRMPAALLLGAAAALQIAQIDTGWTAVDEFAARIVYFLAGYRLAPLVFRLAAEVTRRPLMGAAGLVAWGTLNGLMVQAGFADLPGVALILGGLGACAVVAFSALLAKWDVLPVLRGCGSRSLIIYLSFFLPMALLRTAFVKAGAPFDSGVAALLITAVAIITPLAFARRIQGTRLAFLFSRPDWLKLDGAAGPRSARQSRGAPAPQAATDPARFADRLTRVATGDFVRAS